MNSLHKALGMATDVCYITKEKKDWEKCKITEEFGVRKCSTHGSNAINLSFPYGYENWVYLNF